MKTTIDFPDDLLIEAKKRAAELRTSLRALVTRGVRRELASIGGDGPKKPETIKWVVAPGGLPPGVDLSDRAHMHEWIRRQR